MRRRSVLALFPAVLAAGAAHGEGLEALRWRKRFVLAFAPADDPRLQAQASVVSGLAAQGDDRDLLLVRVEGDRVTPPLTTAEALRRRYAVQPSQFAALLIGKDGGIKLRQGRVLDAALLARTIDAMPMRRSEMSARPGG